jgi:hypothetical protein
MTFSFTATAKCDYCGQLLSDSDEECDHDGNPVYKAVFRRLGEGRDSLIGVEATAGWKWHKLAQAVGEDWIAYEYLGRKEYINTLLESPIWESVEQLPHLHMSVDAPDDVADVLDDDE